MQFDNINTDHAEEVVVNVLDDNVSDIVDVNDNVYYVEDEHQQQQEEIVNVVDVDEAVQKEIVDVDEEIVVDIINVGVEDPQPILSPPSLSSLSQHYHQQQQQEQQKIITSITELSLEKKCEIASKLLQQCPPGERSEILNDIIDIIDRQEILPLLEDTIRDCNIASSLPIRLDCHNDDNSNNDNDSSNYLLLSTSIYKGENIFYNPKSLAEYEVNPFTCEPCLTKEKNENQTDIDPLRETLEQFVKDSFSKNGTNFYCQLSETQTAEKEIILCGHKFKPSNMINGEWKSIWKVSGNDQNEDEEERDREISGTIEVLVHFWEDSNVQLKGKRNFKGRTTGKAEDICSIIKREEDAFQLSLNTSYSTLLEKSFKRLRRTLPISRSKIDWPKLVCSRTSEHLPSAPLSIGTAGAPSLQ